MRFFSLGVNQKQHPDLWRKVRKIFVRAEKVQKEFRRKAIERVGQFGESRKVYERRRRFFENISFFFRLNQR